MTEHAAVGSVSVTKQIPGRGVFREGLHDLAACPLWSWIPGDVEVENSAPVVREHEEDEEDLEGRCRDDEEIDGDRVLNVVVEEGPPGGGGCLSVPDHVLADGGCGDVDAQPLRARFGSAVRPT